MLGLKWRDFAVWIAYCVMLAVVVPLHEPWSNEAQAWLLARDLTLPKLLFYYLRYEGHPALWYLILWGPAHLHLSYAAMGWISAAIAAAGVYVLLRFSPFPFVLRALLPFTYFLAYQYAVVSRSYVLFPVLCFGVAAVYRLARPRPLPMAVLLGLLANVSVHGTLVACAVAVAYAWELVRRRRTAAAPWWSMTGAAVVFAGAVVFCAITIRPPSDFRIIESPTLMRILHVHVDPGARGAEPAVVVAPALGAAAGNVALGQDSETVAEKVKVHLEELPRILSYGISSHQIFSFVIYLLAGIYLCWRGQFLLLGPLGVLVLFLDLVYAREWHMGLLWVVLLTVLWMAWDKEANTLRPSLQNVLAGLLVLAALLQLPWTWAAVDYDVHSQYDPSRQTAAYLHTLPAGLRIAAVGAADPIEPYFRSNPFFNLTTAFSWNGLETTAYTEPEKIVAAHPDVIVVPVVVWSSDWSVTAFVRANGYRETHRFCGMMFLPNADTQEFCYVAMDRAGAAAN